MLARTDGRDTSTLGNNTPNSTPDLVTMTVGIVPLEGFQTLEHTPTPTISFPRIAGTARGFRAYTPGRLRRWNH